MFQSARRALALTALAVATMPFAWSSAASAAPGATPGDVFVTNLNQNSISVINPSTGHVTTVGGFTGPLGIAIAPNGRVAYVTNSLANTVTPVTLSAGRPVPGAPIKVGGAPAAIAITPDGSTAYVSNFNSNTVTPLDLTTSPATPGTPIKVGLGPWSIAVSPSGEFVVVADSEGTGVTVINRTSGRVAFVSVGGRPQAVAIAPSGLVAYVAQPNGVTPVALGASPHARASIAVAGGPVGVAVTPDGHWAITANNNQTVTAINLRSTPPRVGATVTVAGLSQPDGVAISPNGLTAFAANASNTVTPISLRAARPAPGSPINVGTPTFGIAIAPDPPPVARLTVIPARAGLPSTFDASKSTSADGGITKYHWNFGDGTSLVTTTPIVHHTYRSGGDYRASVTETSRLGTSTAVTFTGQTVSNRGGDAAQTGRVVRVPGALHSIPSSGPPGIRVDLRDSTVTATCKTVDVLFDGKWVSQTTRSGHVVNAQSIVIPGNATVGVHHLQLACQTARPYLVSSDFTVVASGNHLSEFSIAMPNPALLGKHLLGAGGLSLGMLLITRLIAAGFPSQWLDSTYENNRHRINARLSKRFPRLFVHHETNPSRWVRGTKGTAIFLGFILAAGGINAVLDPAFGLNRTTLYLFLGEALGVGIVTMASQLPVAVLGAREHRKVHLKVLLGGLVIAIICVSISRLVGLSPGYAYGLIAVYVLSPRTPEEDWGRIHAIASLVLFVVASGAFMLTVPVFHAATSPHPNPAWLILTPALNVAFLGGFASLAFSMFPLPFLPGRHVARWHRGAWLTISTVGMVGFLAVLLSPGDGSQNQLHHVAVLPLLIAFAAFALASLGLMLYFHRHPSAEPGEHEAGEPGSDEAGPEPGGDGAGGLEAPEPPELAPVT